MKVLQGYSNLGMKLPNFQIVDILNMREVRSYRVVIVKVFMDIVKL